MPKDTFDVFAPVNETVELTEEQKEQRVEIDMLYGQVFNTPEGRRLLEMWEERMLVEDEPRFNIVHADAFMYYTSGKRSFVKAIRARLKRM